MSEYHLDTLADLEVAIRDRGLDLTCKITDGTFVVTAINPLLPMPLQAVSRDLREAIEVVLRMVDRKLEQRKAAQKVMS